MRKKRPLKDITGERYGRVVVIEFAGWKDQPSGQRKSLWKCQCDCGNITVTYSNTLRQQTTKSCGCLHRERVRTHGLSTSPEYKVFDGIYHRCNNPNSPYYNCYGGAGIKLEGARQLPLPEGFLNFYRDMGTRPTESHTVERLDVKKGYSKDNCIWTDDLSLQSFNQGMDKRNKSGKTGVRFDLGRGKWVAHIGVKNKRVFLGRFSTFEDAVIAREIAEMKYYGFTKE